MPFPEVIEPPIIGAGPSKEAIQCCGVMLWASDEMGSGAGRLVDRKVDDPKMTRCELLAHKDSADFTSSGAPQVFAKERAPVTWETDRDHRTQRVSVREAALGFLRRRRSHARPSNAQDGQAG